MGDDLLGPRRLPRQQVECNSVLARGRAVRTEDDEFLVVELVCVELDRRIRLRQAGEIDDLRGRRGELEGRLLGGVRGAGDDDV